MHLDRCDDGTQLALTRDDRVTAVGRFLRMFHLDELPQVWNVLRGEMSLIGPRPEPAIQSMLLDAAIPEYPLRRSMLPGLTGLAQVRLGYTTDIDGAKKKLEYDLYYLRNVSLRLDLWILLQTLLLVISAPRVSRAS